MSSFYFEAQNPTANQISGSAFPATLALRIRELEPKGFKLDGVVTVIDCVNFRGYEDTSPSAKVSPSFAPPSRCHFGRT
jgi:hypothetical protein